jgi:hypothetical protein
MGVLARPTVEGVIEVEFSPTVFVVSDEQDGLADDCDNRVLVLLRQAVNESWWKARERDHLPGARSTIVHGHIEALFETF